MREQQRNCHRKRVHTDIATQYRTIRDLHVHGKHIYNSVRKRHSNVIQQENVYKHSSVTLAPHETEWQLDQTKPEYKQCLQSMCSCVLTLASHLQRTQTLRLRITRGRAKSSWRASHSVITPWITRYKRSYHSCLSSAMCCCNFMMATTKHVMTRRRQAHVSDVSPVQSRPFFLPSSCFSHLVFPYMLNNSVSKNSSTWNKAVSTALQRLLKKHKYWNPHKDWSL